MRLLDRSFPLVLVMAFFAHVNTAATPLRPAPKTYQYEPHVETLTGVLDTRIYPGLPNYESVREGDRPNKVWLIKLRHPISMAPGPEPASFERETGIREIHVILTDLKGQNELKAQKSKTVTVTGTIFHAHTIHHPLPLLMDVQGYKLPKPKRPN